MSKDALDITPEVGDVWINTETKAKFVVLDFIKSSEDFVLFKQTK